MTVPDEVILFCFQLIGLGAIAVTHPCCGLPINNSDLRFWSARPHRTLPLSTFGPWKLLYSFQLLIFCFVTALEKCCISVAQVPAIRSRVQVLHVLGIYGGRGAILFVPGSRGLGGGTESGNGPSLVARFFFEKCETLAFGHFSDGRKALRHQIRSPVPRPPVPPSPLPPF